MGKIKTFIRNKSAVAEEFTALPTLSMIMIGLTIFFLIITQGYIVYSQQATSQWYIEKAQLISEKIISPIAPFISSAGRINLYMFNSLDGKAYISSLKESIGSSSFNFSVKISYDETCCYFPHLPPENIAYLFGFSTYQIIEVGDFQSKPGTMTVIVWEDV